jgi:glycosyltransferase involved in cell wall biosynthesis
MKTLYFETNHIDLVGGGGLALYNLAVALQEQFDVYLASPWNDEMATYEFLRPPKGPWKIGRPAPIDVYVASKYAEWSPPRGEVNVFYCLYPRYAWDMSGYQEILTLSEYCRIAVQTNWKRKSKILVGGAFAPDYAPAAEKENNFLSCARFFMEGNPTTLEGHSKGQHHIIQAFQEADLADWTLTLAGSVLLESDRQYLRALESLAVGDPRIRFRPMATRAELRDLYARSKIFVHAMGYRSADPAEVEHYGIVVEKALLSGCLTLVHNSGGAREFSNLVWDNRSGLVAMMKDCTSGDWVHGQIAVEAAARFTWESFRENVREVFSGYA